MKTKEIVSAAMFIALGLILPFFTGQIPEIGSQLSPMHFPVLIAGLCLGQKIGMMVGLVTPVLRSIMFGMPPMIPAVCMSFEMATYGLVIGYLYKNKTQNIYISLIIAMVIGRIVWGLASFIILTSIGNAFSFAMFINGALLSAIPGIILQIIIVPVLAKTFNRIIK